jgi:hypothetical protein
MKNNVKTYILFLDSFITIENKCNQGIYKIILTWNMFYRVRYKKLLSKLYNRFKKMMYIMKLFHQEEFIV